MTVARYISDKTITYNPFTGLKIEPRETQKQIDFFRNNTKNKEQAEQVLRCEKNALLYFSAACNEIRKQAIIDSLSYTVLTKGRAVEIILQHMDSSLWAK